MENHRARPEVRAALAQRPRDGGAPERHDRPDLRLRRPYADRPAAASVLVLRLAQPLEQLEALRGRLAAAMVLALLAAGVAILITSLWLDRRLFRPSRG